MTNVSRLQLFSFALIFFVPSSILLKWMTGRGAPSRYFEVWYGLVALSLVYVVTRITFHNLTSPLRHLPTPSGNVFGLGHVGLLASTRPLQNYVKACRETPNDGIIAVYELFYIRNRIALTTPETIMEVLNTRNYDWEKPASAKKFLNRIIGEGLVTTEGNVHKAMRKSVNPAFTGTQIRTLVPIFWSKGLAVAESMARDLRRSADGELEMEKWPARVTLDIIGVASTGVEFNAIDGNGNKLTKLYTTINDTNQVPMVMDFLVNVFLPAWFVRKMYGTVYAERANAIVELRHNIRALLAEKKQNMKEDSVNHQDMIAALIKSGQFSDEYLCNQLLTFLAAGHETTANALIWATWLLATHPQVQERLRNECSKHLANMSANEVTADVFDRMPYLTAVCMESLRLYTTIPMTAREAAVDTKIGNAFIPKGTSLVVSPWVTNRDPAFWGPDAEEYNPDRWLEGPLASSGGASSQYAFLTFLYGPRSCIGQAFARTEMKCVLSALILRFRLEPSASGKAVELGGFVTLKPKGSLKLKLSDLTVNSAM